MEKEFNKRGNIKRVDNLFPNKVKWRHFELA